MHASWRFGTNYWRVLSILRSTVNIDGLRDALRQASPGPESLTLTKNWITFAKLGLSGWGIYPSREALYVHQHVAVHRRAQYITLERNPPKLRSPYVFPAYIVNPIVYPQSAAELQIPVGRRITEKRHVARALRSLAGRIRFPDDIASVTPLRSPVSISKAKRTKTALAKTRLN